VELASLDRIARRQHGVIARHQTAYSRSAWYRAIDAGSLIPLHPGVVRLVGTADSDEQRIMAAVLAAGPGALASHRSAALLHGIPALKNDQVDIVIAPDAGSERVTRTRPVPKLNGVTRHRPSDIARLGRQLLNGIPSTNILRTLIDLGAVAPDAVHGAVGHALTNKLATIAAIETTLIGHARPGRSGVAALRVALDDWALDGKPADSVLEPAMLRLITRYALPPVEFHPIIGGREVDFRILGTPIVLECDGWTYHGRDQYQFERDRACDAEFAAHGWIVVRFTYRRITHQPGDVASVIRRAIAQWVDRPAPDAA
jgi:very-short-patch-repair endonuclease